MLYPLIDKKYSATLIDNIFTNELTNQIISGLLINDISDHLPILDTFIKLYNKHCPLKRGKNKNLNTNNKPWFTNGLRNACLKKNLLYKEFLKKRTLAVQSRYKSYKNKFTNILRKSEKMYYNQLLHEQRDNIKSTWQTLNAPIKKSKQSSMYISRVI